MSKQASNPFITRRVITACETGLKRIEAYREIKIAEVLRPYLQLRSKFRWFKKVYVEPTRKEAEARLYRESPWALDNAKNAHSEQKFAITQMLAMAQNQQKVGYTMLTRDEFSQIQGYYKETE